MSPRRLAITLITVISFGFPLAPLVWALTSGTAVQIAVMAGGLAIFMIPHWLHMRSGLRGEAPTGVQWGLIVQSIATIAPIPILWTAWGGMPSMLAGSVLLRLRPPGSYLGLAALVAIQAWLVVAAQRYLGLPFDLSGVLHQGLTVFVTGGVIYCVVRLVVVSDELARARTELADAALLRERLRISRDLHDGLGQSLAAIALKGDLAGRMLDRSPAASRKEIKELTGVAREAAQDVREVARGYRELTLAGEVSRGVTLLEASGVAVQTHVAAGGLPRPADEALAWSVREGVTNIIRHSRATRCSISVVVVVAGAVRLEVVNDGAPAGGGKPGNGLTGIAERAAELGGTATGERTEAGGFRLTVEVPA